MTQRTGTILFICIIILAFWVGSFLMTATFLGVLTLLGFIALVESIKPLKWLLERSTRTIDVIIFLATILATARLGLNITASLTVAGIGYSLVYAPRLRNNRKRKAPKQTQQQQFNDYKSNYKL